MSNQNKHTPGPWIVSRNENDRRTIVSPRPAFNVVIAHIVENEECEANARLIAAVHDLLAALESVEQAQHGGDYEQAFKAVSAALKKARGES